MTDQQKIKVILKRREYFDMSFPPIERCDARRDISSGLSNSCPICGYMTLATRCDHDICGICFWQDDGQDNPEADNNYIGPNQVHSINTFRVEIYDWLEEFKSVEKPMDSIEKRIGQELLKLENYISKSDVNKQIVLQQIDALSGLFHKYRKIESDYKINWKFLTEKQMTEKKPAYNSTLPKAGRSWWQKLFGSE
jgi:hypothetical protein